MNLRDNTVFIFEKKPDPGGSGFFFMSDWILAAAG